MSVEPCSRRGHNFIRIRDDWWAFWRKADVLQCVRCGVTVRDQKLKDEYAEALGSRLQRPKPLRDGSDVLDPRLGRIVHFDERSRNFPVRALLAADAQPSTVMWRFPADAGVLDQGDKGDCVGMTITNDLRAYPVAIKGLNETFAEQQVYWGAQRIDDYPGGSYPGASPQQEGTSVLAGVKRGVDLGFYGTYHWAFGEPDVALGLKFGPVMLGVTWHQDMFRPDASGFVRPTGEVAGGHAICCIGYNARSHYYTLINSWGSGWGVNGRCRITADDLGRLLHEDGEAVVVTQRFRPPA